MKRKPKQFDEFHRHEVYDRASVILDLFSRSIAEHPVVENDKELAAEAEKACDALYRFYSKAAVKFMGPATTKKTKR